MFSTNNEWDKILAPIFTTEYFSALAKFVSNEYQTQTVFPPKEDVFSAFRLTDFSKVKVVILGQDPYHEVGQAHGLCFSVQNGCKLPPSLKNVFKELYSDLGITAFGSDLTPWAKQGVLLLNATLTVRQGEANSHAKCGWQTFTNDVISLLNSRKKPVVFVLWGNNACQKRALIDTDRHFIVESAHPSPLSAHNGFFGSKPFSKINGLLKNLGETEIDWQL